MFYATFNLSTYTGRTLQKQSWKIGTLYIWRYFLWYILVSFPVFQYKVVYFSLWSIYCTLLLCFEKFPGTFLIDDTIVQRFGKCCRFHCQWLYQLFHLRNGTSNRRLSLIGDIGIYTKLASFYMSSIT